MKKSFIKNLLTFTASLIALSSCGPNALDFDEQNGFQEQGFQDHPSLGCNSITNPNIRPIQDTTLDGSRRYATCFDSNQASKVVIYGHSSREDWVCAYPLVVTSLTQYRPVKDTQGIPVSQCFNARASSAQGQVLNFYFTGFNGLAIVEYSERLNMTRCLTNGQTCPTDYSMGSL